MYVFLGPDVPEKLFLRLPQRRKRLKRTSIIVDECKYNAMKT